MLWIPKQYLFYKDEWVAKVSTIRKKAGMNGIHINQTGKQGSYSRNQALKGVSSRKITFS